VEELPDATGGDGEVDSACVGQASHVDADPCAVDCEEWAAGRAGVECGVGLDEFFVEEVSICESGGE